MVMLQDLSVFLDRELPEADLAIAWGTLCASFPGVPATMRYVPEEERTDTAHVPRVRLTTSAWRHEDFDPVVLDREVHRAVDGGWLRLGLDVDEALSASAVVETVSEILTRYQRFVERRNAESATPRFERVLEAHRDLYDVRKPLVRADYEHAVDAWRWLLRLAPRAPFVTQVAVLFHDVERLISEPDVRVEQHAADYVAWKRQHAARGAALTRSCLGRVGLPSDIVEDVAAVVRDHEQPTGDPELALVNDADALSFFSLNACGFLDYYGRAHTEKKIRYTLARLSPAALTRLRGIRFRRDFGELLRKCLVEACLDVATPIERPMAFALDRRLVH